MMDEVKDENQAAGSENNVYQKSPVLNIFEDELQAEIFNARCHDINEPVNSSELIYILSIEILIVYDIITKFTYLFWQ